jgi:tRNA(fMet)-specific endonuclease VapC
MYVLDTNTLIYFFKGLGHIPKKLLSISPDQIAIPSVVLYELNVGIAKSSSPQKRSQQLNDLCSWVKILDFGQAEASASAKIRADLEKKGLPIGHHDLLIAGTAIVQNGILITRNIKEFNRIPKLELENWYEDA